MELHHLLFIIACPPTTSLCLHLNQLVLITINQPMDHRYIISVVQLIHQRHQPTAQQGMNKLLTIHFILLHNCKYVLTIILLFSIQSCLLSDFTSLFSNFTCLFADFTSLLTYISSLLTYITSLLTYITSLLTYIFRKQVKHIFLISFSLLIIATLFFLSSPTDPTPE